MKTMRTTIANKETFKRTWYIIDAKDKILGRIASPIAMVLMGKHKPSYTAHVDTGDFVVVINAEKVKVSGNKLSTKKYQKYSGYADGLRETSLEKMLDKKPENVILQAVKRMLPQTRLGKDMFSKLKVCKGDKHPHEAQNPTAIEECAWWKGRDSIKNKAGK